MRGPLVISPGQSNSRVEVRFSTVSCSNVMTKSAPRCLGSLVRPIEQQPGSVLAVIVVDRCPRRERLHVPVGNWRQPLGPTHQLLGHAFHYVPSTVDVFIDVDATLRVLAHRDIVERVRSPFPVTTLADAPEMINPNGEDAVTVEQGPSNFKSAPRTLPSMFTG